MNRIEIVLIWFIIGCLLGLMYVMDDKEAAARKAKFQDCMAEIHNVRACEEWTK